MPAESALRLPTDAVPGRILLVLVVLVLLAHAVVLRHLPLGLETHSPLKTRVFTTRSVKIAAVTAPVARQPQQPVSTTPRPRPPSKRLPPPPRQDGVMAATTRTTAAVVPQPEPESVTVSTPVMPSDLAPAALDEPAQSSTQVATDAPLPEAPATPVALSPALPVSAPAPQVDAASDTLAQSTSASESTPAPNIDKLPASAPAVTADPPVPSLAYTFPGSIRLRFDAIGKRGRLDYRAMGSLTWQHDGTDYETRMEMGDWIIGTRILSSTGKLTADGLAPRRFSDKFRSERAAHFDRQQSRIVFSANTPTTPLLPGAQDQVSIFVQLAALVAGDPLAFPIGKTVHIQTVGPRDAETWVFVVEKEEMLHLPAGDVPALKLVRKPAKDYSQTVELWLAPELAYLPARIRISFANGDYIDQQWRSSSPP